MCTLIYFKIQSDQPRITRNALKSQIFYLFTKSLPGHILKLSADFERATVGDSLHVRRKFWCLIRPQLN